MKKATIQVFSPVTKEEVYSIDLNFKTEISEDFDSSEFRVSETKESYEVTIRAKNFRAFLRLLTRVALELAEDAFYSAFPEFNRLGLTAKEQIELEEKILQGLTKTDIVSEVVSQVLASYFIN